MISRRHILVVGVAIAAFAIAPAVAGQRADYTPAAFEAAQQAGKSILVEVHATWCPTCKAQTPILSKLEAEPRFADLAVFHVDFDTQKDALRKFNAQKQSTLIVFKGVNETGRSVGATDPLSIEELLEKSL
ncbi:MAG: thioredoxin family protein [Rhodoblastus sp.]|nr:thioredoxin family protein [Rhodoblastus sp.]